MVSDYLSAAYPQPNLSVIEIIVSQVLHVCQTGNWKVNLKVLVSL
jgi:hypothetical protein